ncbi:uncharacterized protein LOC100124009 isoform X2 [Nasonia vitripennis]|uniref:G-patch domain-containing protein n=1 Tax=Nasonia vitripennis TaxID=7425 RepID=A0A7M7Q1D0_NASVI|nr:uncharacterized protein LOC100124009 isoform X2 [Nasonia vitripennis]
MAMLAGPKRKQKWTLNPRGKHWSEDSNKFGQKMLEKMGWTSGKGLGAKEQGMVEHIRVKVKNDQVGIGFDKNRDDQWTEHQDDFNSFLQNLQKEQAGAPVEIPEEKEKVLSGKSLEERSKLSQKRVHYKKFTRGKDVNKYSTKDLANIFGKRDLNEKPVKEEKEEEDEKIYDPIGSQDHTAGILTIKGGNINDYFKKKLGYGEHDSVGNEKENSESESEQRVGFGFSAKSKSTFYVNDGVAAEKEDSDSATEKYAGFGFTKSSESKSKVKKHNNLNYVFDNPCLDLNILDEDSPVPRKIKTETVDIRSNETATPKKRKSEFIFDNVGLDLEYPDRPTPKKIKTESVFNGYENPALDLEKCKKNAKLESTNNRIENPALDIECVDGRTQKKSKKVKAELAVNGIENPVLDLECLDRPTPKKSKKIKEVEILTNGIENPALDLECPDRPTPKKSKKVKEIEILTNGIENPALDLEISDRMTPKKSKKIKEVEILTNGIENPALDLEISDRMTPKKSKKIKEVEILTNGIENPALDLEIPTRSTPKKSKKSKEIEVLPTSFENPALDLNHHSNEVLSTSDFEVLRVTCGLENNALDLSDDNPSKKRVTFNDQVEYNTDTIKKKKKKRKLDKYEVVNDKLKKKGQSESEPVVFVNEGLDSEIINEEEIDNEINERKSKKGKRRRRERRMSQLETIQEAPELENSNETPELAENSVKSSDKDVEVVDEFESEDIQEITNANSSRKKNKKRKEKQKLRGEIDIIDENVNELSNEVTDKKKKKNSTKVRIEEITINDGPEKENVCCDKDEETNVNCKKEKRKKKEKNDGDVVSLEEFLSEERIDEEKPKLVKQDVESVASIAENTVAAAEDNNLSSFQKFKKSKQVMKSLFIKNPTLIFNGSNINEIKGYGSHVTNSY